MHPEPGQRLLTHALGLCLWGLGSVALAAGTHTGFYGVVLNGVPQAGFALLVVDEQQRPLMAESDFLALGLAKRVPAVMQEGQALVPLFQLEGLVVTVDHPHQRVALEVTLEWYVHQRLNLQDTPAGQALPAPLGVLLNYGLQASQSGDAPLSLGSTQVLSLFGSAGLVQLATAVRTVDAGLGASGQGPDKKFIRLGTTFWRDDPQQLTTWSVGDEVLQAGTGVPSVRYGGIT